MPRQHPQRFENQTNSRPPKWVNSNSRGKQQLFVAQSPEVLSDLRQVAVVESTESSNRLEGVVVAAHRLKSLVLKNATPQSRSEQEVAGYR